MLSLNQAADLRDMLLNVEMSRALNSFVNKQRMDLVRRMVAALKTDDLNEAKRCAAQDEAYADMLGLLLHFAESELNAA